MERGWQSASKLPVPDWISLTDDHIDTVIGWINTRTWGESRRYFHKNADQLLADTTTAVLGELALTAPQDLISAHRGLLNTVREHGLEAPTSRC